MGQDLRYLIFNGRQKMEDWRKAWKRICNFPDELIPRTTVDFVTKVRNVNQVNTRKASLFVYVFGKYP